METLETGAYVYLIVSLSDPTRRYIGLTDDVPRRLSQHNRGQSKHTAIHRPWKLVAFIWFEESSKAREFERYLKHGSGHAFAVKHFWGMKGQT